MNDLPVDTHPYRIEVTNLTNGDLSYEYAQSEQQWRDRIKSMNSNDEFIAVWARDPSELLHLTHEGVD